MQSATHRELHGITPLHRRARSVGLRQSRAQAQTAQGSVDSRPILVAVSLVVIFCAAVSSWRCELGLSSCITAAEVVLHKCWMCLLNSGLRAFYTRKTLCATHSHSCTRTHICSLTCLPTDLSIHAQGVSDETSLKLVDALLQRSVRPHPTPTALSTRPVSVLCCRLSLELQWMFKPSKC